MTKNYKINIPRSDDSFNIDLNMGECLFILGANGTGKSAISQKIVQSNIEDVTKISATRKNWLGTATPNLNAQQYKEYSKNIRSHNLNLRSRYIEAAHHNTPEKVIFSLLRNENVRAREIAAAIDRGQTPSSSTKTAPLKQINKIMQNSNIDIELFISDDEGIVASKSDSTKYDAAQMSDGERNALLIAAAVMEAPEGHLVVIDEPERHLHRSISTALINEVIKLRPDCAFVIATHELDLPLAVDNSKCLLVRGCFEGPHYNKFDVDLLEENDDLPEDLKRDLLGGRRKILFVEGDHRSLDKALYSILFPEYSVIPKGSFKDVINAFKGSKSANDLHWLDAHGIIDGDGKETNAEEGVLQLPFYSVEALYYHPTVITAMADHQAKNLDDSNAEEMFNSAISGALSSIDDQRDHLATKKAKKLIRQKVLSKIPNDDDLLNSNDINLEIDGPAILGCVKAIFKAALENNDWEKVLTLCSIRESRAPNKVASTLKYPDTKTYESAVRAKLSDDAKLKYALINLLGEDVKKLASSHSPTNQNIQSLDGTVPS